MYRGGGSVGILASVRSALLGGNVAPLFALSTRDKYNLSAKASALKYRIVGAADVSRIQWDCEVEGSADRLLMGAADQGAGEVARQFLLESLADGPVLQTVLRDTAEEQGISWIMS